jgi:predicted signal transduction protein with EAL and GGDEF domain
VTERVLMSRLEGNIETMRRVGELGVRFAIDDFGTGYSSLAYLRRLPIDKLKIDRAFVRAIDTDPADEAIVRASATLGSTPGLAVAAEGVESRPQLERLLALGCEQWQGHHFSPPLAPVEFEALLKRSGLQSRGVEEVGQAFDVERIAAAEARLAHQLSRSLPVPCTSPGRPLRASDCVMQWKRLKL